MQASDFEIRHPTLLHQLIVAAAFLTYLFERDDGVWRFVKDSPAPHALERLAFVVAAILILAGTAICTWARANANSAVVRSQRSGYAGELLYAIGLGSLFPLSGFLILVCGEAVRVLRLFQVRIPDSGSASGTRLPNLGNEPRRSLKKAFRQEAVKWGISLTMIVFVITLRDTVAEILVAASFLLGVFLNLPRFSKAKSTTDSISSPE